MMLRNLTRQFLHAMCRKLGIVLHGRAIRNGRVPTCLCGVVGKRDDMCDAYYCPVSNKWLEARCIHPACNFCQYMMTKYREVE